VESKDAFDPYAVHWLTPGPDADPVEGKVWWDPAHSLWNGVMTFAAILIGPMTVSWGALSVFVVSTGAVLLLGHSVGHHRRMIHRSFDCPIWVERTLVWFGSMVGLSGPFGIMYTHDLRDWAQRQPNCHPALHNGGGVWQDYWWTLHCRLILARPPAFSPPDSMARDGYYRFLQRTWMLHQIPLAIALYWAGGLGWVVWGVCARVAVCVTGHWYVGRLAHRSGPGAWRVEGSGVQASDVAWAGVVSMGEAWHNNHHAFPGSAKIGLYPGQSDWGYRFIQLLERLGLAWNVQTPETLPERPCLTPMAGRLNQATGTPLSLSRRPIA
jgi:stearoyl-CoA desaturase (delta-9 desaturase)